MKRLHGMRRWWWAFLCTWLVVAVGVARPVMAAPLSSESIPPELRPWVPWVLETAGTEVCPRVDENHHCVWPERLELVLDDEGGTFELHVHTDRRSNVPLPGDAKSWPQDVANGNGDLVVLESGDTPVALLDAGTHVVRGKFAWSTLPDTLQVPGVVASVGLTLDGERIESPKRTSTGVLLRREARESSEEKRIDLEVFRRLADGSPPRLTTQLALRVSGTPREVRLGNVLPKQASLLELTSDLPTRIDSSGDLVVQVRAGNHELVLEAILPPSIATLAAPKLPSPWPNSEVWVWVPNDRLRQVELDGAPNLDPLRTNLPDEWKKLRAFSVSPETPLRLKTVRRGDPDPAPNQLHLDRRWILDLDGSGYTVVDSFSGQMHREWRLDLLQGTLGRAHIGGEDQLITKRDGHEGVEVRQSSLDMRAEWRLPDATTKLPAVGWSENADQLSATLQLPPGWELLGASGVDEVPGTWLSSWDLFDLFYVLILTAAVGRLLGVGPAVVTLVALTLGHDQDDAPLAIWAVIVIFVALLRVVPAGWFRRALRWGTAGAFAVLAILLVSFGVHQARVALFPQTGHDGGDWSLVQPPLVVAPSEKAGAVADDAEPMAVEPEQMLEEAPPRPSAAKLRGLGDSYGAGALGLSSAPQARKKDQLRQDPSAIVQTGPGVPNWSFRSFGLQWSGPVHRDHTMRLWLLSPPWVSALTWLRILVTLALAALLLRAFLRGGPPPTSLPWRRKADPRGAAVAAGVLMACLTGTTPVRAEVPPEATLQTLKERLTAPAPCQPNCLSVAELEIDVRDRTLSLRAQVHAGAATAYKLPGPAASWTFDTLAVDGRSDPGAVRLDDGHLHVRLEPGTHEVTVSGPIPGDDLTLALGDQPHRVVARAIGWSVDGIHPDATAEGTVQLTREIRSSDTELEVGQIALSPWVLVERRIRLGVTWTIETQVKRLGPLSEPLVVRYPLLPSEQVTDAGVRTKEALALISMNRGESETTFSSTWSPRESFRLTAEKGERITETFILECGPIWHCTTEGPAAITHEADGVYQPRFEPWPGETVQVQVTRPEPAPGQAVTVDQATLDLHPGTRITRAELELRIRNSSGGVRTITLPETATFVQLTVDGVQQPVGSDQTKLDIALSPGLRSVSITWQDDSGLELVERVPGVELGGEAVNARVNVHLPRERWLLLALGPAWGPAILFWGYLILLLAFAALLARLPGSPLDAPRWMLLSLGLTQVPAVVAVIVAAWFFVVAHRHRWVQRRPWKHDFVQVVVAGWTIVFLGCLVAAVWSGLVTSPDMEVQGAGSSNTRLSWYVDRVDGAMPTPTVVSVSIWVFRLFMLAWALWLSTSLLRWLKFAWQEMSAVGLWVPLRRARALGHAATIPAPMPTPPEEGASSQDTSSQGASSQGASSRDRRQGDETSEESREGTRDAETSNDTEPDELAQSRDTDDTGDDDDSSRS